MLVIIGVICVLFYIMFMSYYVEHYKSADHPQQEEVYYLEELTRRYGASATSEQIVDFIGEKRGPLLLEAEEYFKTMPIFSEAGVYSYDDYKTLQNELWEREVTQAEAEAYRMLNTEECGCLGFWLSALRNLEEYTGVRARLVDNPASFHYDLNEKEQQRFFGLLENGEDHSILSYWTYTYTESYLKFFSVLLTLSLLVLLAPLLTKDRLARIHYLQYSAMHGRKIIRGQFIAILISAFLLTTLLLLVFGGIFSTGGTGVFWDNAINSDFNLGVYTVFNLTYGQWVMAGVGLLYLLSLSAAAIAFIISRFSENLVTLIMKLIPVFAALAILSFNVFGEMFGLFNPLYSIFKVFGTEVYICGALALLALALTRLATRKEKQIDVL